MTSAPKLAKELKNVGPKLAERMIAAGINTPDKLRALGAKKAFVAMYPQGDAYGDFNAAYLYALEGAIRDCDWSALPEKVKSDLKGFAQGMQKEQG